MTASSRALSVFLTGHSAPLLFLQPPPVDLIRCPKFDSVDRLDMVSEVVWMLQVLVSALRMITHNSLPGFDGMLSLWQMFIVKVVVPRG